MRFLGSFVFLIGALSVGAYAYFPSNHIYKVRLEQLQTNVGGTTAAATPAAPSAPTARTFSPGPSILQTISDAISTKASDPKQAKAETLVKVAEQANGTVAEAQPSQASAPAGAWRTVVTNESADARRAAPKANDYQARYELVRSLQGELSRVGCYQGDVDGDWGPGSKRAASEFLRKVNATLPVDTPDYILLTLIQGHADKACGVDCSAGKSLGANGHCVPNVIVARGPERGTLLGRKTLDKVDAASKAWTSETTVARAIEIVPPPQRAHEAGAPQVAAAAIAAAAPAAQDTPAEPQAGRGKPMPGMMAIGAPPPPAEEIVAAPVAPAVAAVTTPPLPAVAPKTTRTPRRQAKLSVDGDSLDILADPRKPVEPAAPSAAGLPQAPAKQATTTHGERSSRGVQRPAPVRAAAPARVRAVQAPSRWRNADTVRTTQGRVRRGSPQHNLMLSLGGVF